MPIRRNLPVIFHNLLPVRAGTHGDCRTGSSPDSGSSLTRTFPKPKAKVVYMRTAPRYSGGTVPAFNRLPY